MAVAIDHQQLFDPVLVQQVACFLAADPLLHGHQPALGHQFLDRLIGVVGKADVAVGQDSDQPIAAFGHDGNAGNAVMRHQLQGVGEALFRIDGDRVTTMPDS